MKTLPASKLAESLDLEPTDAAYYEYIIDSFVNGVKPQAFKLFQKMDMHNKETFSHYCEQNRPDVLGYLFRRLM
jgi:hypothetical protein